jgi:hypothetical protein
MVLIWKNKMDTISCGLPFCRTSSDLLRKSVKTDSSQNW